MSSAAYAQDDLSGNGMLPYCKQALSASGSFGEGLCHGYISGMAFLARNLPPNLAFCRPQGVTHEQQLRIVVRFLENNPQRLHETFPDLAFEALRKEWPCPK